MSQQKAVWKLVADVADEMLTQYDKIWIYTHGYGVPYLHIRVSMEPQHYLTKEFI
jgi:hypothetical protein